MIQTRGTSMITDLVAVILTWPVPVPCNDTRVILISGRA